MNSSSNNPDLYLVRGQKYRFNNTTGSNHPFAIRVSNGGSAYTDGVSGDDEGVQFFMVPLDAPAQLVYQCTAHSSMVGNIYMRGAGGHNNNVGFTTFSNKIEVQSSSNTTATFKGSGGAGFINITDGDDGTLAFLGVDGGTFKIQTSGGSYSDKLTVAPGGDVTVNTGNLVIGTADKGIDFSANSHLSGKTEEILNHYEVGTYVPTWTTIASSPTTYRNGITDGTTSDGLSYVRIGKQVTITGAAFWSGGSSINNTRPNMSLPFPARIYSVSGTVSHYSLGETEDIHYLNYSSSTSINFYVQSANSQHEAFGDNSNGEMYFNITYMTTD